MAVSDEDAANAAKTATPAGVRPSVTVAVVMERVLQPNRWEEVSFRVLDVIPDEGGFGTAPRKLVDDGKCSRWLYPGFVLELFPDECKGYFLNLTSGRPVWFVMWRLDEDDPTLARPMTVSVSYIECDRWMAAEERVENVTLPDPLCEWLRLYTNAHFKPDQPRRQRAMSFLSPEQRDRQSRSVPGLQAPAHAEAASEAGAGAGAASAAPQPGSGTPDGRPPAPTAPDRTP